MGKRPPATTPEGRENQLINLAVNLAEQKLLDGTAPATVITHYLRLATEKEMLEREKLRMETELLKAKEDAIRAEGDLRLLYEEAIVAMRSYQGVDDEIDDY